MSKKQYSLFALFVGVQSLLLQLIDQLLQRTFMQDINRGFVFVAFQGWALYFLLGSKKKGALQGMCGYAVGIAFAIIMLAMGDTWSSLGIFAIPLVTLIVVPVMMYFEFAPWCISNVSIFFLGAGAFYGIFNYVEGITVVQTAGIVLFYCGLGFSSGWISILFRRWYEQRLKENEALEKG